MMCAPRRGHFNRRRARERFTSGFGVLTGTNRSGSGFVLTASCVIFPRYEGEGGKMCEVAFRCALLYIKVYSQHCSGLNGESFLFPRMMIVDGDSMRESAVLDDFRKNCNMGGECGEEQE